MWQNSETPPGVNTHDGYKTSYESNTDSGYLSGQLASSCSLSPDGDLSPHDDRISDEETNNSGSSESRLDISKQLSDMNINSANRSTISQNISSNTTQNNSCAPVKRTGVGLTHQHLALLRDIFRRDDDGETGLHIAVSRGFVEAIYKITQLLPHQALLDLDNDGGCTPLHSAVITGNHSIIRHLIICGCSPVSRNNRGDTPLHIACRKGDNTSVAELTRPVHVTEVANARLCYTPSLRAGLLAADLTNYEGETCMHVAVQGGFKEILHHLSWYGADINAKEGKSGRTALHYAVESRDLELVAFVAKTCRASLHLENYAGLTSYQLAMANGATGIAAMLLDLGAADEPLPEAFTAEDDFDYDQESGLEAIGLNEWAPVVDDFKIGGMLFPMATPVPVSTCTPFNADIYL